MKKIFVTSYLQNGDGVVATPSAHINDGVAPSRIGRPNKSVYIHGAAQDKMETFGGWDLPCFFGYYPENEGIHEVAIVTPLSVVAGKLYLWANGSDINGLIVSNDDVSGNENATELYNLKTSGL